MTQPVYDWRKLQEFANQQSVGFLKDWKAQSMVATLERLVANTDDWSDSHLEIFVYACLGMEGFDEVECQRITDFINAGGILTEGEAE